jgi:hypothetical protein
MPENDKLVDKFSIGGVGYYVWLTFDEENKPDFYNVFGSDGFCINEGNPQYTQPTRDEVVALLELR